MLVVDQGPALAGSGMIRLVLSVGQQVFLHLKGLAFEVIHVFCHSLLALTQIALTQIAS